MNVFISSFAVLLFVFSFFDIEVGLHMIRLANTKVNDVTSLNFKVALKFGVKDSFIVNLSVTILIFRVSIICSNSFARDCVQFPFYALFNYRLNCIMTPCLEITNCWTCLIVHFAASSNILVANSAIKLLIRWRFLQPGFFQIHVY